ncbi:cell division protein FtsK [Streptococcus mutans]|nr:cell division protein FtsK [Streptococcus mutans]MCB4997812.1 cell division protein FtsK [Streptococcus mutans]MCB5039506.1 cell division protein FtsK [Streptococcus mutans]MCB5065540.1 cell division protein FtsK [Streptococcus mutans]MCB5109933.1 cell division protein FtsK [Streptococcus mutans]
MSVRLLPQYRGTRVRPYMRFYDRILFSLFFFPSFVSVAGYAFFHREQYMALQRLPLILSIVVLVLGALVAVYLTWFLQEATPFFKKIERLKTMSKYLYNNGYYTVKKRPAIKQGQSGVREKIIYPKVYLKQGKYDLEAAFEMAGSKFQEKFKKIGSELETTLFMDFMEATDEPKYKIYKMAYSALLNRIEIPDVSWVKEKGIRLMKNFFWDFISDPHLLIAGGTGGGKTVFLRALVLCLSKIGVVDICDPKRADFVTMADILAFKGRVSFTKKAIVEQFEKSVKIMFARYEYMRQEMKRLGHKDMKKFYEYGLEPYFLICDELNGLKASLDSPSDYKLRDRLDAALTEFVLLGRQAGCSAILAMQKPAAEDLPSKIRANMMMHISVGRLDEYGNDAMFGQENRNKEFKFVKYVSGRRVYGRGYAAVFGEVAREFYSPLLKKGFSFFDAFEAVERHANLFDPSENEEIAADLTIDESLREFAKKANAGVLEVLSSDVDTLSVAELSKRVEVKPTTIRHLIGEIEKADYRTFSRVNGKHALTVEDGLLLEDLLEQKETFDGTWKELLALYFDEDLELEEA